MARPLWGRTPGLSTKIVGEASLAPLPILPWPESFSFGVQEILFWDECLLSAQFGLIPQFGVYFQTYVPRTCPHLAGMLSHSWMSAQTPELSLVPGARLFYHLLCWKPREGTWLKVVGLENPVSTFTTGTIWIRTIGKSEQKRKEEYWEHTLQSCVTCSISEPCHYSLIPKDGGRKLGSGIRSGRKMISWGIRLVMWRVTQHSVILLTVCLALPTCPCLVNRAHI